MTLEELREKHYKLYEDFARLIRKGLVDKELQEWFTREIKQVCTLMRIHGGREGMALADHLDGTGYIRMQSERPKRRKNLDVFEPPHFQPWSVGQYADNARARLEYEKRKKEERRLAFQLISAALAGGHFRKDKETA